MTVMAKMLGIKKEFIRRDQRGILCRKGDFVAILPPGEHRLFDPLGQLDIQIWDLTYRHFNDPLAEWLLNEPSAAWADYFDVAISDAHTVILHYQNQQLLELLPPNTRRLFWRGFGDCKLVPVNVDDPQVSAELYFTLLAAANKRISGAKECLQVVTVPQYATGMLSIDGVGGRLLPPGQHVFWRLDRQIAVDVVDLRRQTLEVSGQEILTLDKVAVRINLAASFQVTDPLQAYSLHAKPLDYLYRELQFGLRAAVGTRNLDQLLEDKQAIDRTVYEHLQPLLANTGLAVDSIGVKDIILPGDMKLLLAQVVEAEKAAQANLIRRREETAATRALLNTAKVMEDNPTALRLKELETLERVTGKIDRLSVYGGLEGLLNGLVSIRQ